LLLNPMPITLHDHLGTEFLIELIKVLSQIADFWGYHGTYAQEPAQQI